MSDSKQTNFFLSSVLLLLTALFTTLTFVQFRWIRELQTKYEASRESLQSLQTLCLLNNGLTEVKDTLSTDEIRDSRHAKRSSTDTLQQMMTDMMVEQEKILLSHCLNNSKLCIPGPKGSIGPKGEKGYPGTSPQAIMGPPGSKGDPGIQGLNGTKGDRGLKGEPGPSGVKGDRGPLGPKGVKGDVGEKGDKGDPGMKGVPGPKGQKGDQGVQGPQGNNGTDGLTGQKGEPGPIGPKGDVGKMGPPGPKGEQLQTDCLCLKKPVIDIYQPQNDTSIVPIGTPIDLFCGTNSTAAPVKVTWQSPTGNTCPNAVNASGYLHIASMQPSNVGEYTCTLDNGVDVVNKTFTILLPDNEANTPLDCDFERTDLCNWRDALSGDQKNWLIMKGSTDTQNTGPTTDHTIGTIFGHYVYIESSLGVAGDVASLVSPSVAGNSSGGCLTFWYNMYGSDIGNLQVTTKTCAGRVTSILNITGDQGRNWHQAQIQLPGTSEPYRILLDGTEGSGVLGDIALDDISFTPGKCQAKLQVLGPKTVSVTANVNQPLSLQCNVQGTPTPTYTWQKVDGCVSATGENLQVNRHVTTGDAGVYICNARNGPGPGTTQTFNVTVNSTGADGLPIPDTCDFENLNNIMCGWEQDNNDVFNWTLQTGPTQSTDTGPDFDHTLKDDKGHYYYIEASSPRQQGEDAILTSHRMRAQQDACFSFQYYMFGDGTGSLEVYAEDVCIKNRTRLFQVSGAQGQQWHGASISIPRMPTDYRILVRADIGPTYHGDTAVDDLNIKDDTCIAADIDCTFDNGNTCFWKQSASDDFDWMLTQGPTQTTGTGPSQDYPTGTGSYMFIESSKPRNQGDVASLLSHRLPKGQDFCFHIATSRIGSDIGAIRIVQKVLSTPPASNILQEWSGALPTPEWEIHQLTIPATADDFQIEIQGIVGSNYLGDAAIDDISIASQRC